MLLPFLPVYQVLSTFLYVHVGSIHGVITSVLLWEVCCMFSHCNTRVTFVFDMLLYIETVLVFYSVEGFLRDVYTLVFVSFLTDVVFRWHNIVLYYHTYYQIKTATIVVYLLQEPNTVAKSAYIKTCFEQGSFVRWLWCTMRQIDTSEQLSCE